MVVLRAKYELEHLYWRNGKALFSALGRIYRRSAEITLSMLLYVTYTQFRDLVAEDKRILGAHFLFNPHFLCDFSPLFFPSKII